MQIPPSEKTDLIIAGSDLHLPQTHQSILLALTPTSTITFTPHSTAFGASAIVSHYKLIIPIPDSLRARERSRLEKEQEKLSKLLTSTQSKLSNAEFRSRAPQEVVAKLEAALTQTEKQLAEISQKLKEM
jgi:valyl-tRNA synthetase